MAGRQRSFRDRLHGFGLSWHLKSPSAEVCRAESPDPTPPSDKENKSPDKKPLTRTLTQPKNTVEYVVQASDTLSGVAARFETTPSELANLNRLASRVIFPGQVLYVPSRGSRAKEPLMEQTPKPKPQQGPAAAPPPHQPRFLKLNSRYFTDGLGVVSGVLMVTPNAFMFDPNVSDTLVLEHGAEVYGVAAPMDVVVRAAMYNDIAHMAVRTADPSVAQPRCPKPQIYHAYRAGEDPPQPTTAAAAATTKQPPAPPLEEPIGTKIEAPSSIQISPPQDEEESSRPQNTNPPEETPPPKRASSIKLRSPRHRDEKPEGNLTSTGSLDRAQESSKERMLKRLSYPVESLTSFSKILVSSPKTFVDFSSGLFVKTSEEEPEVPPPPATEQQPLMGYKNMVEGKTDLFESLDKIIHMKPRRSVHEEPPLYLCLRMGRPVHGATAGQSWTAVGKRRLKPEYWFAIPFLRAEELYNFLHRFQPRIYGEVDVDPESLGFQPIELEEEEEPEVEAPETSSSPLPPSEGGTPLKPLPSPSLRLASPLGLLRFMEDSFRGQGVTAEDWEVLSLADTERSLSVDLSLPELVSGTSELLGPDERRDLSQHLPARAIGYGWSLLFSTSLHGFSLSSVYRRLAPPQHDGPVLLVLRDTDGFVFGAISSSPLKISETFYGTGESCLFTFHDGFKCYHWTGENLYFTKGNPTSLAFGAGDGDFGLWIDGDLNRGRTCRCQTFGNDPLCPTQDFIINTMEAWGFV